MDLQSMILTAKALVEPGKGILAADESTPTMTKRLAAIGLESTEARRREYRQILFTAEGIAEFVSGVILFDPPRRSARCGRSCLRRCRGSCSSPAGSPTSRSPGT
jgi:fructose-bisphosphate aldolase, class I